MHGVFEMRGLEQKIAALWLGPAWRAWFLLPFSMLFGVISAGRRWFYRLNPPQTLPATVVVVGGIHVGGSGKTPLCAHLAGLLERRGLKVGIILRGYRGRDNKRSSLVKPSDSAESFGDEAILLAGKCDCPVVVGRRRRDAAQFLWNYAQPEIIISDDGLQHYALPRDIEIVVIDITRHGGKWGNDYLLPAGPLREPARRINSVDQVVYNGDASLPDGIALHIDSAVNMVTGNTQPLSGFKACDKLHAIAGIGHPQRFFNALREQGLDPVCHQFPDHHPFTVDDLGTLSDGLILMTEKDAVKCRTFAQPHYWMVPAEVDMNPELEQQLIDMILGARRSGNSNQSHN